MIELREPGWEEEAEGVINYQQSLRNAASVLEVIYGVNGGEYGDMSKWMDFQPRRQMTVQEKLTGVEGHSFEMELSKVLERRIYRLEARDKREPWLKGLMAKHEGGVSVLDERGGVLTSFFPLGNNEYGRTRYFFLGKDEVKMVSFGAVLGSQFENKYDPEAVITARLNEANAGVRTGRASVTFKGGGMGNEIYVLDITKNPNL